MTSTSTSLRRSLLLTVPVWAVLVADALADCQPAAPANGQTVTCTGTQPTGFVAPAAVTGLTVNIRSGAVIGSQQTSAGANPSFTSVRVNGTSVVNNAGVISNSAALNRDNFGVNLAGDRSTLNNTGVISLTAPAGNTTTRIYGAYSSAPDGQQYASTSITNGGVISVVQNGNGRAQGVYAGENTTLFTLTNTGVISATRGTTATASTNAVAGVDSDDDTDRFVLNNAAGAQVAASGTNTRAVNGRAAQLEINNSGTISVTPGAAPTGFEAAIATYTGTAVKTYNTVITNAATGVINGDVRNTDVDQQTAASVVTNRRLGTLTNAGTINGNLVFGNGNQTINNTGRISGNISFLDVAAAGAVAGTVNTVNLGTGSSIGGNITARGLGTNNLNLTGTGTLTGTVSGFTNLTQNNAGSAWTTGAGSVQTISGNLTVAGGNFTLGAGSTQTIGGLLQVTGSGATLTVNNTQTNKTVNLSGSNTTVVNNGTLTGTGVAGRANTAATRVYGVLANSTGADFANVAVVNNGTIAVTENGIGISRAIYAGENIASMSITNSGTISATRNGTGMAAVAAIDSDDDVAALTVTNNAGATISGTGTGVRAIQGRAQTFTIANAGTITGPAGGQAIVVYGNGNGLLTNASTGIINGDVRFTDADPQVATSTARRNSTTVNSGRINGSLLYGMGNATLFNTGTITGPITFNDVAASRNTVNLGTGSSIGGAITAQGRGVNALNLAGTGTLASNVAGFTTLSMAGDAWTLASGTSQTFSGGATVIGGTLTVNSVLTANTLVGAAGTLTGTGRVVGTLTNAGIVVPGNAATPYGTLSVTGNYVQQAGGTLRSAITADGQSARLVATGTASLAGTVGLIAAPGTYLPNTRYTVLTAAGGVTGTFSAVTDSGTVPFLIRPTASTDANNAYVTLVQQSFGLVAQTANQRNAARGLDAALANNPAALLVIDNQSNTAIAGTLDRVAGQAYASMADPQLRSGRAFGSQMLSRAYAASSEAGPQGLTLPPTVYAADLPSRGPVPEPRVIETSRGYGLWATGYGQFGTVDSTANAAGRSETVAGLATGIDFHPQVGTVLGIAAGYGSVDVSLNRTGERAHTDNAQVGIYGGFTSGAVYGNLALGYARADGRVNRSIEVPQLQAGGAQGAISGDQLISAGELGYRVAFAPTAVFSPFVGFQVNTFDQDRVRETGLGPFDLNVAARDFLSARTLAGGRLETATTLFGGRPVSLWVKAAYVHDFADVSRTISSAFALAPTVPFLINGRRLDRDRALVGLGLSTELAPGLAGFVAYDAELASTDTIQAVRGGIRYNF